MKPLPQKQQQLLKLQKQLPLKKLPNNPAKRWVGFEKIQNAG
ncbi:MAG: hypothetical protein ACI861_001520 [Paracoccaceae bacterium]